MAELKIANAADAAKLHEYEALRDAPRQAMANGVYPNCVVALKHYEALVSGLGDDFIDYADFHTSITAQVTPYIETIQQAMQTIVGTMQAIEKAAPGTFGIETPETDDEPVN